MGVVGMKRGQKIACLKKFYIQYCFPSTLSHVNFYTFRQSILVYKTLCIYRTAWNIVRVNN